MIIAAAGTNTTQLFATFLNALLLVTGSYELAGFLIAVAFIFLMFTTRMGKETAVFLGLILLFGLWSQGFINQIIFYLALVIIAFVAYKAFANFGRKETHA